MARMKNFMQMTGSMAMVSMYTMQGHDEVIIRTKGGPTKRQIKTKPQFEKLRRNNSEWAGCTRMSSRIRNSIYLMKRLEDYPFTGALNAVCKYIQKQDSVSEHGQRSVYLSAHKEALSGLSFSKKQVLESVLRVPISVTLDRENGATIELPAIHTGMYLYNFRNLPYFRLIACLSGVRDMVFSAEDKRYDETEFYFYDSKSEFESEWHPTTGTIPATTIRLSLNENVYPLPDDVTMLVCLGIEFGKIGVANTIEAVKYAGTGKILKVG